MPNPRHIAGDVELLWICILGLSVSRLVFADPLPKSWHVDRALYPKAYGVLASEHLMFPVDMGDWPVKIDGSRQLFIDDYLIASMKNVSRQVHQAKKHHGNPIIVPDKPWEIGGGRAGCVFHIIRHDPKTGRFRMWYAGYTSYTLASGKRARFPGLYAESADGLIWQKPELGLYEFKGSKANNIIIPYGNLWGVFYEPNDPDPNRRYKGLIWHEHVREGYYLYTSPDGIRWTQIRKEPVALSLQSYTMPQNGIGDTSLFRWDSRLGKYIGDVKFVLPGKMRVRGMMESDDLIYWTRPRMTIYPDGLDDPDSQIYGHMGFYYESMWIGFMRVMHTRRAKSYKQTTVELTASRDGRHWTRVGKREEFIALGKPNDWDAHYHDPSTEPILIGNELWIYYRSTRMGAKKEHQRHCIGLAKLRRDGFVSLNAGEKTGTVVTRPLTFKGKELFVNAEVGKGGYVKAGLRKRSGKAVRAYTLAKCTPVTGNVLDGRITWEGKGTIECPPKTSLRLVFELKNAKLYSFWIK